jgi:membrane-associated phospholipid phosphatase
LRQFKILKKIIIVLIIVSTTVSFSDSSWQRWDNYLEYDMDRSGKLIQLKSLLPCLGLTAGIYFVSRYDSQWNSSMQQVYKSKVKKILDVSNEFGNIFYALPAAAIITAGALNTRNETFQDAAFTSLTSIVISTGIVAGLKILSGRSRPLEGKGPYYFRPFSGKISFPSNHTAIAFALFTPWVLFYPNVFTCALLIVPVSTGLARMAKDRHWASDVLTGGMIGFTVAYFLTKWHKDKNKDLEQELKQAYNNRIYWFRFQIPL